MECYIAQSHREVIRRAYAENDYGKAATFERMLTEHLRVCQECAGVEVEPVIEWKSQVWWKVREK